MKKAISTSRNKIFIDIDSPLNAMMVSKNMNERISFPLNRKFAATGRNKGFV